MAVHSSPQVVACSAAMPPPECLATPFHPPMVLMVIPTTQSAVRA
jgi:hypothetical protein